MTQLLDRKTTTLSVIRLRRILECKEIVEKINKFNKLFFLNIPKVFYDKDGRMDAYLAPFVLREICDALREDRIFNAKNVLLFENRDDMDYKYISKIVLEELEKDFCGFCNLHVEDTSEEILDKIKNSVTSIIIHGIIEE